MAAKPKKLRCAGTTKKGKRCSRPPMAGFKHCVAHADRKEKDARGFGGPQPGSGRPKQPRVIDVLKERLEERADEVIDVYLDAMKATKPVQVGYGEDAYTEEIDDHAIRLKAVEALNDRAYGKPKQVSEITGAEGGPVVHSEIPSAEAFQEALAKKLEEVGAA